MATVPLARSKESICSISFSNTGSRYICSGGSGQISELPSPDYPKGCFREYKHHKDKGPIMSISIDSSGQRLASGSSNRKVRIWEIDTARCSNKWKLHKAVEHVAWNPSPDRPFLAVSAGLDVYILNAGSKNEELLHVKKPAAPAPDTSSECATWTPYKKHNGIRLKHTKTVSSVGWHWGGDYFSSVMPSVLIHQLSKKITQGIPFKLHGIPVSTAFHPSRPIFVISTRMTVRVYDLLKQELIRKLDTGPHDVSSIGIHPGGDDIIVGYTSGELHWFSRLCSFDTDLTSKLPISFGLHRNEITGVAFHQTRPLFASCSDDRSAYVFHAMVYPDRHEKPLIVPLGPCHGHYKVNGKGVMDCKFHPTKPWLFTAGADSVIKQFRPC